MTDFVIKSVNKAMAGYFAIESETNSKTLLMNKDEKVDLILDFKITT